MIDTTKIEQYVNKGMKLKRIFRLLRKQNPYYGETVILRNTLFTAFGMGKPFQKNELNKILKTELTETLEPEVKEDLRTLCKC